jgi:hypothetical protein
MCLGGERTRLEAGCAGLIGLYFLARLLGMRLTLFLFQVGLTGDSRLGERQLEEVDVLISIGPR